MVGAFIKTSSPAYLLVSSLGCSLVPVDVGVFLKYVSDIARTVANFGITGSMCLSYPLAGAQTALDARGADDDQGEP